MAEGKLALVGGKVLTMAGETYDPGMVLIQGAKIAFVGQRAAVPQGFTVIALDGKVVMPGLVDAHTHLGIKEEIYQTEGDDTNEINDPVTPHLRALDAINPLDIGFSDALEAGVTTVYSGPGSANVIGGLGVILKTSGIVVDRMVLREPAGMKVAFGENPKRIYGELKKAPITRMGIAALLRENLFRAREYQKAQPERRCLKLETLVAVLEKRVPLRAHAHRADDIMTALRVAREFQVDLVIEHGTEGHLVADELAKAGIPVVVGPSLTSRLKVELKERSFKTLAVLLGAGVKVAITTDHPEIPLNYLNVCAALAVREGLPEEEALKAITVNAAEILGVDERVGSLAAGKDADVIILNGHPLDYRTRVERVLVDGREVFSFQQPSERVER